MKMKARSAVLAAAVMAAYVVDRALAFIRANALRKLSVDDVVAHLGISTTLAYLRFQEAGAGTIANAILKARLAEVAKRLRASETPISHLASQCSFNNLQQLANAFKRQYGQSMTAYRRASQATLPHESL